MKTLGISILLSCLFCVGCEVTVRGPGQPPIYEPPVRHPQPEVVIRHDDSESVIMLIDSAKNMISESDKRDIYMDVATRPILSERVQIHLINAASRLISESRKEDIYLKMAVREDLTENSSIHLIDAAGRLISGSAKQKVFLKIASRRTLLPLAQKHLVTETFLKFISENSKSKVLLTLIKNPHFGPEAEKAIYENIDKLISPSAKKNILNALADRQRAGSVNVEVDTNVTYIQPL